MRGARLMKPGAFFMVRSFQGYLPTKLLRSSACRYIRHPNKASARSIVDLAFLLCIRKIDRSPSVCCKVSNQWKILAASY